MAGGCRIFLFPRTSLPCLGYDRSRMADRPTSVAMSVEGLHQEESADRARALRDRFTHAQEQSNHKQAERPREAEKAGSQMVKEDQPVLRPTPNGPMRQMPNRQAAVAKVGKEHDNSIGGQLYVQFPVSPKDEQSAPGEGA